MSVIKLERIGYLVKKDNLFAQVRYPNRISFHIREKFNDCKIKASPSHSIMLTNAKMNKGAVP